MIPRILGTVDPEFRLAFALCLLLSNSKGDVLKTKANLPDRMYRELKRAGLMDTPGKKATVLLQYRKQALPELIELLGFVCNQSNIESVTSWHDEHKVEKDDLRVVINERFNGSHKK